MYLENRISKIISSIKSLRRPKKAGEDEIGKRHPRLIREEVSEMQTNKQEETTGPQGNAIRCGTENKQDELFYRLS